MNATLARWAHALSLALQADHLGIPLAAIVVREPLPLDERIDRDALWARFSA